MADRVRPLKLELPRTGGTQTDEFPTSLNPNEDGVDCRAAFLQNDSSADSDVYTTRDASNNLILRDSVIAAELTLTDLRTHAPRHNDGGGDELTAQSLGSGAALSDYIMKTDGAGAWTMIEAPGEAFGASLTHVESVAYSSTTSDTYQQKLRLTSPTLPSGNYIVLTSCIVSGTANNTAIGLRLQEDDTTNLATAEFRISRADSQFSFSTHDVRSSISGVHTYDLDWSKPSGSGSAGIEGAAITLWRIS